MLGSNLLRYNNDQKYMLFDVESFHLNLMIDNPPWQCSWLIATKDKILKTNNYYINWELAGKKFRMSKGAAEKTKYNDSIVKKDGRHPKEVYDIFKADLRNKNHRVLFHNGLGFDVYIERQWCEYIDEIHNWEYLDNCIDTNAIARAIKLDIKPDLDDFLAWQYKLINFRKKGLKTSISQLIKDYKLIFDEDKLHNAAHDIEVNFEIFKKQIWEIEI